MEQWNEIHIFMASHIWRNEIPESVRDHEWNCLSAIQCRPRIGCKVLRTLNSVLSARFLRLTWCSHWIASIRWSNVVRYGAYSQRIHRWWDEQRPECGEDKRAPTAFYVWANSNSFTSISWKWGRRKKNSYLFSVSSPWVRLARFAGVQSVQFFFLIARRSFSVVLVHYVGNPFFLRSQINE